MTNKQITIVVGAQWGDEGKGKITDLLAQNMNYVVRFHGGNNAGHTVVVGDDIYKLHLLPSGIISPHITSIIGNGVVVDPAVLLHELDELKQTIPQPRLLISERAHVIMPYHIAMDEALSGHQATLGAGSTKRGIAPVYADKAYRHGIRVGDLIDPDLFKEKLQKAYEFNTSILKHVFNYAYDVSLETIFEQYREYGEQLKYYIHDTEQELYRAYTLGQRILFEGAQGMSLDPDHGMYPHTTSSNNVSGFAEVGSGVGLNTKKRIVGVVKAYVSRVGNSPFTTELTDDTGDFIREKGVEYGTTTGRPRRIGWLDLVQVRQSIRSSALTELAITKLDVLAGLDEIRVCNAYMIQGKIVTEMPASLSALRDAKAVYTTHRGWADMNDDDKKLVEEQGYEFLPENMKHYIHYIEQQVRCKAQIISFGPKRNETIVRD